MPLRHGVIAPVLCILFVVVGALRSAPISSSTPRRSFLQEEDLWLRSSGTLGRRAVNHPENCRPDFQVCYVGLITKAPLPWGCVGGFSVQSFHSTLFGRTDLPKNALALSPSWLMDISDKKTKRGSACRTLK